MATLININFDSFEGDMEQVIAVLNRTELWLRPVTAELSGEMAYRIHQKGLASDGSQIGSYSSEYLNRRLKNKLGTDSRVILVYTRKLSNSWGAFATQEGWGVGFNDEGAVGDEANSLQKIQYNEKRFNKPIIQLTDDENEFVETRINELVTDLLRNV